MRQNGPWSGIAIIYRKELLDILRDRKTLIFMLLIPTLAIPLLISGINQLAFSLQKKQAVKKVTIAATPESQAAYERLVHRWFLRSPVANQLRLGTAAAKLAGKWLAKPEHAEAFDAVPEEIFTDTAAFVRWTKEVAAKAREGVDRDQERTPPGSSSPSAESQISESLRDDIVEYYEMTIKALGLVEFVDPESLTDPPEEFSTATLSDDITSEPHILKTAAAVQNRIIHGYLQIPAAVNELDGRGDGTHEITFIHDSTIPMSDEARNRVRRVVRNLGERLVSKRLDARDLKPSLLKPLVLRNGTNLATKSEIALHYIGGILPYFVIALAFLGGMYPAIDLGAGEKERNTLETLVLSPATRTEIAAGKFLVILTTSLTAALVGMTSIVLSVKFLVPAELLAFLDIDISAWRLLVIALLAIPPAAAFAGIFLAISIFARSFKEAQSYIAPLQFVLILPAMAPMLPGLEMSWRMALIPLVNVSMLSKDFLKGDTNWSYYALTVATCFALAVACIAFAVRQFHREEVLFRS